MNELNVSSTKQSQQGVREEPRNQAFACGVNLAFCIVKDKWVVNVGVTYEEITGNSGNL